VRLLFVVNNPGYGGGNGQIVRLREPLQRLGWEVLAVTPAGAPAAPRLRAGGVEVAEVPLHRLRATPDPRVQAPFLAHFRGEVRGLRELIRRRDIDVVQPHGDTNPHAALAAHREGVAVAWQIYDTRTPVPLRRLTMPLVTRVADVITTWGHALGHAYPGVTALDERWIPVFPPVDGAQFAPDPARRAAARAELGIAADAFAVGAVGMLNPSKGFEYLVRAVASARERDPRIVARILGPPSPAHPDYERAVSAEAARLGGAFGIRDAGDRVAELMPAFDALALTSVPRSEGMPTVILEAMACALPVVATDVGAVSELVAGGETGFVVAPEDPAAIADRLLALAADPELQRRLGATARERFEREFGLEVLARTYARAYDLALTHRARRPRR
jgi:glycosyltransferase involved in cell wall biosynthesis